MTSWNYTTLMSKIVILFIALLHSLKKVCKFWLYFDWQRNIDILKLAVPSGSETFVHNFIVRLRAQGPWCWIVPRARCLRQREVHKVRLLTICKIILRYLLIKATDWMFHTDRVCHVWCNFKPGYTYWITIIFGTPENGSLKIISYIMK